MCSRVATRCTLAIVASLVVLIPITRAEEPLLGFVTKLGQDMDVRSGARVLADELAASNRIILPDLDGPVIGTPTVPQIQLRGGNLQANSASEDYVQIF